MTERRSRRYRAVAHLLLVTQSLAAAACGRCSGPDGASQAAPDQEPASSPFDPDRPADPLASPADPLASPAERAPLEAWNTAEDYRMRALRVEPCEVEPYFAPQPGHEKLGVLVELEGRTAREVPVNVLHATVEDASGQTYEPTPAGCRPTLAAGRVARGQTAQGFISFELPKDAAGLVLRYQPVVVGRSPEPLRFDLQR